MGAEPRPNYQELEDRVAPTLDDFNRPFEVHRWLIDNCKWPPFAKLCYMVLYRFRNQDTNQAWPKMETIAEGMGVSKNTAIASVKTLEAAGAVTVRRDKTRGKTKADVNLYTLIPPWDASRHVEQVRSWKYTTKADQVHVVNATTQAHDVSAQGSRRKPERVHDVNRNMPNEQANKTSLITPARSANERRTDDNLSSSSKKKDENAEAAQALTARLNSAETRKQLEKNAASLRHDQEPLKSREEKARSLAESIDKVIKSYEGRDMPRQVEEAVERARRELERLNAAG